MMKSSHLLVVVLGFLFLARADAGQYVFEVHTFEYKGEVPDGKMVETLLKVKELPVSSWKTEVAEGKTAGFDQTVPYPYPTEISAQGVASKFAYERVGRKMEVNLIKVTGTHARLKFSISEIKLGGPNIMKVGNTEIWMPTFERGGSENAEISLELGYWLILPGASRADKSGMVTAMRLGQR